MQKSLADIIMTSGSTLHETLTSVLSYAKINQFERRQHEYRQRQPPDTVWALTDKEGFASGPDRDYEDLYICSNLAILCEEILGVLEAGKSFHGHHAGEVIVVCNIEHQEHWIYHTEPGAFRRIAVNLIGNALKYTKSGSLVVTLSTAPMINDSHRVSRDLTSGHTLTLTIEDTGRGMSKEFMDNQLFIPFSQEDPTSTHGVGLGMSIVKSLVSLLSGEIEVRSAEGKGTKISVNVPMRLCTPDDCDKGEATAEFDHDVETIRERKISAVIYGFPQYVRESLTNYLCDWFNCTLLEPTKDARPDIVLVDEGNEDIMDAVNGTAKEYGERGVLLSIVMVPSKIGKKMHTIDGYIKWERIPRPLGPSNVARSLLSCLEKMDELRKHGKNAKVDTPEPEMGSQARKNSASLKELTGDLTSDEHMPDLEKLEIAEAPQNSSSPPENVMPPDSSGPVLKEKQSEVAKEAISNSKDPKTMDSSGSLLDLRILVVDDNHLNLKLLATFFKKRGYRNVSQVTDGSQAVEEVKKSDHGVDMIFMVCVHSSEELQVVRSTNSTVRIFQCQ
jgi:CheY-like chemotaxis protein